MQIVTNFTSTEDYSWLWCNKHQNFEILVLNYLIIFFREWVVRECFMRIIFRESALARTYLNESKHLTNICRVKCTSFYNFIGMWFCKTIINRPELFIGSRNPLPSKKSDFMSAFYIIVIYILINQGDISFKSVIFRFLRIFNGFYIYIYIRIYESYIIYIYNIYIYMYNIYIYIYVYIYIYITSVYLKKQRNYKIKYHLHHPKILSTLGLLGFKHTRSSRCKKLKFANFICIIGDNINQWYAVSIIINFGTNLDLAGSARHFFVV